jgi:O-antigen ligase
VVSYLGRGAGFAARARGPVGHYMTFAGQLLLLVSLAAGIALTCRRGSWRWSAGLTAAIGSVALAFTYTRSAWLGLSAALLVIAGVARRRWIPAVAGLLLAVYFFAPGEFRARLHSSFEPRHATNVERTLMWKAGWRMFRERPWTGVGLQDLRAIYPRYREPQAREVPGHLHSDFVQIAATMGLVGLAAFVLLYGSLFVAAGADLPRALPERGLAAGIQLGVVAGLVGFLVAGCFEWNFGDEELLDLLYVLVGLAFATRRWPASAGAERLGQTRVEVEHAHAEPADPERAASAPSHARDT